MSIEKRNAADDMIVDAGESDVEAIARLHHTTFEATYPSFPRLHTPEDALRHFKEVIGRDRVPMVKRGGRIVAYCAFGNGWLNDLYVDPEYQRQGLGTLLLNRAKAENPELRLWTFQENKRARSFYENKGFAVEEETDGRGNQEKQPDVRYVWRNGICRQRG